MKILLACLMCIVLGAAECFAIDGGPVYTGQVTVTGTYAGVFIPLPVQVDPGPPPITQTDNSFALFTLSIQRGTSTTPSLGIGTIVVFRNGLLYNVGGIIQASADPDSAKLTGVLTVTDSAADLARGQFVNTRMVPNNKSGTTVSVRVKGKASINYTSPGGNPNADSGVPIIYRVSAFKQSEAA